MASRVALPTAFVGSDLLEDDVPAFGVADVGVEGLEAGFEIGIDRGDAPVVRLEMRLLETKFFQLSQDSRVYEMPQPLTPM